MNVGPSMTPKVGNRNGFSKTDHQVGRRRGRKKKTADSYRDGKKAFVFLRDQVALVESVD
jgi:Zn-finger nucleic acid-binding protein